MKPIIKNPLKRLKISFIPLRTRQRTHYFNPLHISNASVGKRDKDWRISMKIGNERQEFVFLSEADKNNFIRNIETPIPIDDIASACPIKRMPKSRKRDLVEALTEVHRKYPLREEIQCGLMNLITMYVLGFCGVYIFFRILVCIAENRK